MRAIRKDPGEMPYIVEIPNTLAALQDAVGGWLTAWGLQQWEGGQR